MPGGKCMSRILAAMSAIEDVTAMTRDRHG
jgi:hypothetical protein